MGRQVLFTCQVSTEAGELQLAEGKLTWTVRKRTFGESISREMEDQVSEAGPLHRQTSASDKVR